MTEHALGSVGIESENRAIREFVETITNNSMRVIALP